MEHSHWNELELFNKISEKTNIEFVQRGLANSPNVRGGFEEPKTNGEFWGNLNFSYIIAF
jgi:hypothetical protein